MTSLSAHNEDDVPNIEAYSPFVDVSLAEQLLDRYADVAAYPPSKFSADATSLAEMVGNCPVL